MGWSMTGLSLRVALLALLLTPQAAAAQDARHNAPGQFDFYVLSLSWSPSFCAGAAERGSTAATANAQCGPRPYSFVVHGLWPQYEKGFPEYCQLPPPRLDRGVVSSMLDLMPAPGLVINEWNKHGTCWGANPRGYFETMRKARAMVKIPDAFIELARPLTLSPDEIEEEFVKVNPGLSTAGMAVICDNRRLREVRLCLTKDFRFRDCQEIDRRACRVKQIVMPPVRGARGAAAEER